MDSIAGTRLCNPHPTIMMVPAVQPCHPDLNTRKAVCPAQKMMQISDQYQCWLLECCCYALPRHGKREILMYQYREQLMRLRLTLLASTESKLVSDSEHAARELRWYSFLAQAKIYWSVPIFHVVTAHKPQVWSMGALVGPTKVTIPDPCNPCRLGAIQLSPR